MRILLVSSAFSGLTQRFYTELVDAGYTVSVELHTGNMEKLQEGVNLFAPDLILCPFLTKKLPSEIYKRVKCLIVHPGIKGDRGPSSLDWAIQNGETEWGVTLLEADEEMDAGPVWASKNFPLRAATKSNVFYRDVTPAAVECLWQALSFFDAPHFKPEIQDYNRPDYKGKTQPLMKQTERAIDWKKHKTDEILRRIHAADGMPGVLDEIYGLPVFLFNAHKEPRLTGKPGDIIAIANHAICRATVDGAIWIGHLKAKLPDGAKGIKLPATFVLKEVLPTTEITHSVLKKLFAKPIKMITIDYTQPGRQWPCQEVWFEQEDDIGYLYFHFHNGAMSTEQCRLLLSVYQYVATLPIKAIVLVGGDGSFSNGIHLNHIEAADSPADESWLNINAIDDLVYQIITTMDKVTVAALAGSAGAGGAMMPLAADQVFAREGVIFNAHYKNMGELYGSEYWTYLLSKRVGQETALMLTEQRLPISAKKAWQIKLVDKVLDKRHDIFMAQVKQWVKTLVADNDALQKCLAEKAKIRCYDESLKALAVYRRFELTQMYANFYGSEDYHIARHRFVYKVCEKCTPENLAVHRQKEGLNKRPFSGSLYHFVWQDHYHIGDDLLDSQHKDLFILADQLASSASREELVKNAKLIYLHVKEHFGAEEDLMEKSGFHNYKGHVREHNAMLERLVEMDQKISNDEWRQSDIQEFMDKWGKHIIHSDRAFDAYQKQKMSDTNQDSLTDERYKMAETL